MRLARIKTFLVVNPGAVLIIIFAALVFACAYLLILGSPNNPIIDSVAVLAYCFFTSGIVFQAVGFIRGKALGERV
jgi:predicted neutral ceramidase superfamily lipid hydrolase